MALLWGPLQAPGTPPCRWSKDTKPWGAELSRAWKCPQSWELPGSGVLARHRVPRLRDTPAAQLCYCCTGLWAHSGQSSRPHKNLESWVTSHAVPQVLDVAQTKQSDTLKTARQAALGLWAPPRPLGPALGPQPDAAAPPTPQAAVLQDEHRRWTAWMPREEVRPCQTGQKVTTRWVHMVPRSHPASKALSKLSPNGGASLSVGAPPTSAQAFSGVLGEPSRTGSRWGTSLARFAPGK